MNPVSLYIKRRVFFIRCPRRKKMKTVRLPNYSISNRGYEGLGQIVESYGFKKVVLVGGKRALKAVSQKIRDGLRDSSVEILGEFIYGKECTLKNIEALKNKKEVLEADVIFGIGGGKALDTVKVLSYYLGKPCISFPTICSNCAGGTAIAVVYNDDGSFLKYEPTPAAVHIFVEIETIAQAPEEYFWAGIGDGISKKAEVLFASQNDDPIDFVATMGLSLAESSQDTLIKYGEEGLRDVKNKEVSRSVESIASEILINTGYISNLTNGEDYYYNSSLAHVFFNLSTLIERKGEYLHGYLVSFGVLVLHAYDKNYEELEKIARFNKKLDLALCLEDLGLKREDVFTMADHIEETLEWKRSSVALTRDKFIEACLYADEFGKK